MDSGQGLINDALKMISGCVIPSSVITNCGSLSTTYFGSVLSSTHGSGAVDCVNSVTVLHRDISNLRDFKADAFATTLFPASAILNSCFSYQKTSVDAAVCQSATLTVGAGSVSILFS